MRASIDRMVRGFSTVVLALTLLGGGASTAVAAGSTSFADTAADAGAAPDITAVTVANDDQGLITFRLTVANRSTLGADDTIAIPLATNDPDLVKGSRNDGANYVLGLDARDAFLLQWNGASMDEVDPRPTSVTGSFSDGVATITVKQEDLAPGFPDMSVPISFNFYALGLVFNGSAVTAEDDAPDGTDFWSYRISAVLRQIVTNFDADKTIKAGKTLTVFLGLAHGDTGEAVSAGKVTCRARIGAKALKGSGHFVTIPLKLGDGVLQSPDAICSWKVPKMAKKKTIKGSISVSESGFTATRPFSTKVR
jgi:hypothetical protein